MGIPRDFLSLEAVYPDWGYADPVDMLDPIHIRSGLAGKHWPEAAGCFLHTGLLLDWILLARTKSDPQTKESKAA